MTSTEMMDTKVHDQHPKNVEKMRPSATTLVQRYTRNGKSLIERQTLTIHFIETLESTPTKDSDLPKTVRPPYILQKSKLTRIRSNSLRQHRNDLQSHSHSHNHTVFSTNEWTVKSGCHFNCIENSMGIQIVSSNLDHSTNIQLCYTEFIVSKLCRKIAISEFLFNDFVFQSCDKIETTQEFATNLCRKYQKKVRGLSGNGMQIAPSPLDPDRGCKVACQDEYLSHRFYLVNGDQGYFPYGTKCSRDSVNDNRYCVNGKCLQFDQRNIPLVESHISLALYRTRRSTTEKQHHPPKQPTATNEIPNATADDPNVERTKRNFMYYEPINVTEKISRELLNNIVSNIVFTVSPIQGKNINLYGVLCCSVNKLLSVSFFSAQMSI